MPLSYFCFSRVAKKYENPMEHACDMCVGQVFVANGWQRPEGFYDGFHSVSFLLEATDEAAD